MLIQIFIGLIHLLAYMCFLILFIPQCMRIIFVMPELEVNYSIIFYSIRLTSIMPSLPASSRQLLSILKFSLSLSVHVSKLQVAILARLSREMSQTVRIV